MRNHQVVLGKPPYNSDRSYKFWLYNESPKSSDRSQSSIAADTGRIAEYSLVITASVFGIQTDYYTVLLLLE